MRLTDQGYRLPALELQKKTTKSESNYLRHPNTFLSHFQRTQILPISSVTYQFHHKQAPQAQVVGNPQILANRKGHLLQSLQVQNQVRDCSIYQETQPPNSLIQELRAQHLLDFSVCQLVHQWAMSLEQPSPKPAGGGNADTKPPYSGLFGAGSSTSDVKHTSGFSPPIVAFMEKQRKSNPPSLFGTAKPSTSMLDAKTSAASGSNTETSTSNALPVTSGLFGGKSNPPSLFGTAKPSTSMLDAKTSAASGSTTETSTSNALPVTSGLFGGKSPAKNDNSLK